MTLGPVRLPLPPSANNMHRRTVRGGKAVQYATDAYREWLIVANEMVRDALMGMHGNMPPLDLDKWWGIEVGIFAGPRRVDTDNVIKPVLDLLSGHYPGSGGRIEKQGLLFDDDRRVKVVSVLLETTHEDEPAIRIYAYQTGSPCNMRELAKYEARQDREAARLAKKGGAK